MSFSITIKHPVRGKFYRARPSMAWIKRHDNGALISCGLTVDEPSAYSGTVWLTDRAFKALESRGVVVEITEQQWKHSGCQSSCILRGNAKCSW